MTATPTTTLFKTIAFVLYPVANMQASRAFYEEILGLKVTANWEDQWVEYDIGEGTLAITTADPKHRPGVKGALIAIEVTEMDAMLAYLKEHSVAIVDGPFDSPVCRGCMIADPDGNDIMLHQKLQH